MHAPVVLKERGEVRVVRVRQNERAIRNTAAKCYCKQQIVIVNMAIAVAIEVRPILHGTHDSLLEHAKVEVRTHTLELAAGL